MIAKKGAATSSPAMPTSITYFTTKTFDRSLAAARLMGGLSRKRSDRARIVLGSLQDANPFAGLQVTKNGESRIKNCVKYELGDAWRLVTVQTDKTCTFLFVGDHADAEDWLNSHKGEDFGVKDRQLVRLPGVGSEPIVAPMSRQSKSAVLVEMLDEKASDYLLGPLPPSLARKFGQLYSDSRPHELAALLAFVEEPVLHDLLRTVFGLLMECNVDGAQAHIDRSLGHISPVENFDSDEILEITDGEEIRRLRVGSIEYGEWLFSFEKRSSWYDWFLFLHPEQEAVVNANFGGVSQLSGVSGSGKTCIAVRRAMRLAEQDDAKVLLLTLNRSLAGLLRQLVDAACVDEAKRGRIEVTSFFELAKSMLLQFEPESEHLYEDVTWKLEEHVDEVFREFYRRWANNNDAVPLFSLHKSMNARGVSGETYIRQEFDWIRSAVMPSDRSQYLTLERKGRKFPILADRRADLLLGLLGWEAKMRAVGVIDYLGLTSALSNHLAIIKPQFTNILVDEAQDFGTTELNIIRALVSPGQNDIFLCGDIAQTVLPKHRAIAETGLSGFEKRQIRRNYRNSRQILTAAYRLLERNLQEELFDSGDLEVLDPKFANFGDSTPLALAADLLETEISYARTYAATRLDMGVRNICIAFAGFSSRDVAEYAKTCCVTALDGNYDPASDRLVFSDLEQTKGYEFDVVIVLNCCDGVLPAADAPRDEQFRDLCRLYVAMTRAKRELILSYHGKASDWLETVSDTFLIDDWKSVEILDPNFANGVPVFLPEHDPNVSTAVVNQLDGQTFLYSSGALGLSVEAQDKIHELVDGKGLIRAGSRRRLRWQSVQSLVQDLLDTRLHDSLLGSNVADEIREKLASVSSTT